MNAFELKDVHLSYGQDVIVSSIQCHFKKGAITTLIGPNGCGKSTLMQALVRQGPKCQGDIALFGAPLAGFGSKALAQQLAYLPQSPITPEGILVKDLVAYGRAPYLNLFGRLTQQDWQIVQGAMERVQVAEFAHKAVQDLSGGQRQRVWIAMALAQDAPIILLDEPTTYLDLAHQYELLDILADLRNEGRTVIMVLHDLNQACRYGDELLVMKKGQKVAQGSVEQVMTDELLQQVFGLNARVMPDPLAHHPSVQIMPKQAPQSRKLAAVG